MLILGIETSCDETGVALYDTERGLLAHTLYSQIALHSEYGGVVPELASRDHRGPRHCVRRRARINRRTAGGKLCRTGAGNGLGRTRD